MLPWCLLFHALEESSLSFQATRKRSWCRSGSAKRSSRTGTQPSRLSGCSSSMAPAVSGRRARLAGAWPPRSPGYRTVHAATFFAGPSSRQCPTTAPPALLIGGQRWRLPEASGIGRVTEGGSATTNEKAKEIRKLIPTQKRNFTRYRDTPANQDPLTIEDLFKEIGKSSLRVRMERRVELDLLSTGNKTALLCAQVGQWWPEAEGLVALVAEPAEVATLGHLHPRVCFPGCGCGPAGSQSHQGVT